MRLIVMLTITIAASLRADILHSQSRIPNISEIRHAYLTLKTSFAPEVVKLEPKVQPTGDRDQTVSLVSCLGVASILGSQSRRDGVAYDVAHLAFETNFLTQRLTNVYPMELWQSKLMNFETAQIAAISSGADVSRNISIFKRQLADELNSYRKLHSQRLPLVSLISYECNAGGVRVEIVSKPDGAQIKYMNFGSFKVCKESASFSLCDWISYGGPAMLLGNFMVWATWPNKEEKKILMNVDQLAPIGGTRMFSISRP